MRYVINREVKQKFLRNVPAADSHPNSFGIILLLIGEIYS